MFNGFLNLKIKFCFLIIIAVFISLNAKVIVLDPCQKAFSNEKGLAKASGQYLPVPGDTIALRPGQYDRTTLAVNLIEQTAGGNAGNPVVVTSMDIKNKAEITEPMEINGSHLIIQGFALKSLSVNRAAAEGEGCNQSLVPDWHPGEYKSWLTFGDSTCYASDIVFKDNDYKNWTTTDAVIFHDCKRCSVVNCNFSLELPETGGHDQMIDLVGAVDIVIKGCTFYYKRIGSTLQSAMVQAKGGSWNILVEDCRLTIEKITSGTNIQFGGILAGGGERCLDGANFYNGTLLKELKLPEDRVGQVNHMIVRNNIFVGMEEHPIDCWNGVDVYFINNTFINCGNKPALFRASDNVWDLVVKGGQQPGSPDSQFLPTSELCLANNIIYNPKGDLMSFIDHYDNLTKNPYDTIDNLIIKNNLIYNGGEAVSTNVTQCCNAVKYKFDLSGNFIVTEAPDLFVDYEKGDYRLKEGSIAIDRGMIIEPFAGYPGGEHYTSVMPDNDHAGNIRVQGNGIDLGAFESSFISFASGDPGLLEDNIFMIFPNPVCFGKIINLHIPGKLTKKDECLKVSLYDISGKCVWHKEFSLTSENNIRNLSFNINERFGNKPFAKGIYVISISKEGAIYSKKMLIIQ
ncbi:MAG: T9SS type A sorting domain-containing protein [bacterium]